jgi:hypothetical protein
MFTTLFSVEARICPAEQGPSTLVLQLQDWTLIHDDESGVLEYPQCGVEFQVDLRGYDGKGRAVVVTRWSDLGSGLTPDDPRLLALVSRDLRRLAVNRAVASSGLTRHLYRAASEHEVQGEDITERNYRYLAEREYRHELRTSWLDRGVWTSSE